MPQDQEPQSAEQVALKATEQRTLLAARGLAASLMALLLPLLIDLLRDVVGGKTMTEVPPTPYPTDWTQPVPIQPKVDPLHPERDDPEQSKPTDHPAEQPAAQVPEEQPATEPATGPAGRRQRRASEPPASA